MARDEQPRLLCVGGSVRRTGEHPGPSVAASLLWLGSLAAALASALADSPAATALALGLMALAVLALIAPLLPASSAAEAEARSWRQTPRDLWLQGGQMQLPYESGGRLLTRAELLSGHLEQGSPSQNLHTMVLTTRSDMVSLITPSRRQGRAMLLALGLAANLRRVVFTLPGEAPPKPLPRGFIMFTMALAAVCGWLLADSMRSALAGSPGSHAWPPLVLPVLGRLAHTTSPRLLLWLGWLYALVGIPFFVLWRRRHPPRPRRAHVGHDGMLIEGELEFMPWASVSRSRRTLAGLDLVMRQGPPVEIKLGQGQLPNNREDSLKEPRAALREALMRAVDEARHASAVEPTTAASARALLRKNVPSPVFAGEEGPYRQGADPHEDFLKILHDGSAPPDARVAAVEALAQAQAPAAQEQLKHALDVLVEPATREALRRAVAPE